MSSPLDSLLNLSGVTVEGHSQVEGYICIHLKILAPEFVCPHCSKPTQELHQVRSILVRDLPTFGQPVYLRVPRRQFYCRNCQKYVTQRLDFLSWRRRYTQRGVMEGINNKIKLIIRLGYGLSNFDNLRSRLLGCCS